MSKSDLRISLMHQLHVLNRDYLDFLIDQRCGAASSGVLAPAIVAELANLGAAARFELCQTPYSLYYLPFNNATFWYETSHVCRSDMCSDLAVAPQSSPAHSLSRLILFLAWHLVRTEARLARWFFSMSTSTLEFFRVTDVSTLTGMAQHAACLLQPRWPSHPHFWPDMIRYVGKDSIRLQTARLLGAQLIAAELGQEETLQWHRSRSPTESCNRQQEQLSPPESQVRPLISCAPGLLDELVPGDA